MQTLVSILAFIGAMTILFILAIVVLYFLGCDVSVKYQTGDHYNEENDYES